jgi:Protein of unknown function (DUF4013)
MATPAPVPSGSIDFGRCFAFLTEDPEWLGKVLVGGLFTLLSAALVGLPFVLGYVARTLKRVAAGEARPLPAWDDLGGIFNDGLRVFGVQMVYSLGVGAVALGFACVLGLGVAGLGTASHQAEAVEDVVGVAGGLGFVALYAVILVAAVALGVYLPAALVRTVWHQSFAEGFNFRGNVAFITANLANYALSVVAYLVAGFVAQFGLLLCIVGFFPAAFCSYLVAAHALGQTVRLNPTSL